MKIDQPPVDTHNTAAETAYWQEFYKENNFYEGSTFCEYIKGLPDVPDTIIDIGCGQGRDSLSFAQVGKNVIGLDRSEEGISHSKTRALSEGLSNRADFYTCDISNYQQMCKMISTCRRLSKNGKVCYYLRFFLHSIPEDTQEGLMRTLSEISQDGDFFVAEFRTDKDQSQDKKFGVSHYRRYQNASEFSKKLREEYGWHNIVHEEESQGLSVYEEEDPFLYRVVATR